MTGLKNTDQLSAVSGRIVGALANKQGDLVWIDKSKLNIDRSYQRDLHVNHRHERVYSEKMASAWNWPLCGALIVAERADGSLWIIDGQHRHDAAMLVDEIANLPCIVFPSSGGGAEAGTFVKTNIDRRRLSPVEVFRALVAGNDAMAVALQNIVESSGMSISTTHTNNKAISCPTLLMTEMTRSPSTVKAVIGICSVLSEEGKILDTIISAMIYLERTAPTGHSVLVGASAKRIIDLGYASVFAAIKKGHQYVGERTPSAGARGLSDAMNRGKKHYPTKFHPPTVQGLVVL